jgi:hypothetical protein
MGGAFVALADDVAAIVINPAGLATLSRREFGIEFRTAWNFEPIPIGPGEGMVQRSAYASPTLVSAFEPIGTRMSLGAYVKGAGPVETSVLREGTRWESEASIKDRSIGFGAAVVVHEKLAIGSTLGWRHVDAAVHSRAANGETTASICDFSLIDAGNAAEWSVGALVRPTFRWNIGASYQSASVITLPGRAANCDVTSRIDRDVNFATAGSMTVGTSFRLSSYFKMAIDAQRPVNSGRSGAQFFPADDHNRVNIGGEYLFLTFDVPFALRAGVIADTGSGDKRLAYSMGSTVVFVRRLEVGFALVVADRGSEATVGIVIRP